MIRIGQLFMHFLRFGRKRKTCTQNVKNVKRQNCTPNFRVNIFDHSLELFGKLATFSLNVFTKNPQL